MFLRKISNQRSEISIDEPLNSDADGNELILSDVLAADGADVGKNIESEGSARCYCNSSHALEAESAR